MTDDTEHVNPFASPLATDATNEVPGEELSAAETIRRELLATETNIKSSAVLYGIAAFVITLLTLVVLFSPRGPLDGGASFSEIAIICLLILLATFMWYCAIGMRQLKPSVRPWVITLSSILLLTSLVGFNPFGLVGFNPIGLLFNGFVLWLVVGNKGKRVLTHEYQEIIAATPHIKLKTSIIVWILLAILLLIFVVGVFMAVGT